MNLRKRFKTIPSLKEAKMVSVIIPTLNEEKRIAEIVNFCFRSKMVSEVIVIDDGSTDNTFAKALDAGAKVFFSSMLGKGVSMFDGLWKTQNDIVLYLDGDIYNFNQNLIELMTLPLTKNDCDFVKGKFHRTAGRVTELTAKPLLKSFFPEIADIEQPLGGIIAAKKDLLKNVTFEPDYGVDIGILIDVNQLGSRIIEVDIGNIDHDHQPLSQLGKMSTQIVRVILDRASKYKRLDVLHLKDSYESQRVSQLQLTPIIKKINPEKKIALFDMDGTLVEGRFIDKLARYVNKEEQLQFLLDNPNMDPIYRTKAIAKILTGVPKSVFEKIASMIPLAKDAQKVIVELKKRGFSVGIVTDSYFIASEIIRKRVFADFSIAHLLSFKKGIFTGNLEISPFMLSEKCTKHPYCKLNLLDHIDHFFKIERSKIYFAGDGLNDICLLQNLANAVAVRPKHSSVSNASTFVAQELNQVLHRWN